MANKKLVVLSDYGLDDAVAAAYLMMNKDKFKSIDIVAVAGNTDANVSLGNAVRLVSSFEGDISNIRLVRTTDFNQNHSVLPSIHGKDGMGDLGLKSRQPVVVTEYKNYIESLNEPFILLSLGPLTVTEDLLKKRTVDKFLIMAGLYKEEPNFNGMEFNQALDAKAYAECVKTSHVVATLDSCRQSQFNLAGHRFNENKLLGKLINRAVELAEARHIDNSYIYDFIASLYLIKPDIFTVENVKDEWGNAISQLTLKDKSFSLASYVESILNE